MRPDITDFERRAIGVAAFSVCAGPVLIILALAATALLNVAMPEWLVSAGMIGFIVCAGLQWPIVMIVGEMAGDQVAERDRSVLRPRFRHPFYPFALWWRYVRKPQRST